MAIVAAQVPSFEAGRAAWRPFSNSGATGVVAFDDLLAQGILAGLSERGIDVPGAIAVVGCDDVLGAATYPPLTTVSNRSSEAGKAADLAAPRSARHPCGGRRALRARNPSGGAQDDAPARDERQSARPEPRLLHLRTGPTSP